MKNMADGFGCPLFYIEFVFSKQQLVAHLDKQQPQHDEDHAAHALAAALHGVARAAVGAQHIAGRRGERQQPPDLAAEDEQHRRGDIGAEIRELCAA